jgi:hypothetical protein
LDALQKTLPPATLGGRAEIPSWTPSKEGNVTADPTGYTWLPEEPDPSLDELLREAGSRPVENIHDLAVDGFFETDEELDEFLRFYHEQRQSNVS